MLGTYLNILKESLEKKIEALMSIEEIGNAQSELLKKVSSGAKLMGKKLAALEQALIDVPSGEDMFEIASYYRDSIFTKMNELRAVVDELETITPRRFWKYPSYGEMLYSVR